MTLRRILTIATALLACCLGTGCMLIWHDDVLVVTLFKTVDANDIGLIAEPNYIQIGSGKGKTSNDKLKASALVGVVPVVIETESKGQ